MASKEIKPVFLIYSSERLLLEEAIDRLKARLKTETAVSFESERFNGGDISPGRLLQILRANSLFSDLRLIVIDDADHLEIDDELLSYIEAPLGSVHLVLMAEKFDKRSRLYKLCERLGYAFEYKPLPKGEIGAWVKKRFAAQGVEVSNEAVAYIISNVDNDLLVLKSEIEKVLIYSSYKGKIGLGDVASLVSQSFESSIFELVELIGERDKGGSLEMLSSILARGEAPSYLFHMILRQFRLILKAKVLLEKRGLPRKELASKLKLPFFVAAAYEKESRNFSFKELIEAHSKLLKAEVDLKTGKREAELILETLIEGMTKKA